MLNSAVRRVIGFSEVTEQNGRVIISGVSAEYLSRDMKRIWSTSKVASAMFVKVSWSEVIIPAFFALELEYILRRMLDAKGLETSKRVIRNIIEGLNANTWLSKIHMETGDIVDQKAFANKFVFDDLLRHQYTFLHNYNDVVPKYGLKGYLLSAAPGAGKAQPLHSKVLTPYGFRKMGDLKLGDEVTCPDGEEAKITGLFPQGVKAIYKLQTTDRRITECCLEHLWNVKLESIDAKTATIQTEQIIQYMSEGKVVYIPTYSLIAGKKWVAIESITYKGEEEAQCIMIDHPEHLYITDDYIVTHNTVCGCALALAVHSDKVIIVCPKVATQRVWQKTLNKEFKEPQYPYIAELDGDIQPKKKWHIFHYEALDRAIELASTFRDMKVTIILDESHNMNEIKSLRTLRFLNLCKIAKAENILWASGTPVKAMGFECIPLLKSIDPLFTDEAELAFRKMFGKDAKRTLDILAYRLGLISHSVPKSEFMPDEPEVEVIKVKMPDAKRYTLSHLSTVMAEFIVERTAYYQKHRPEYQRTYDEAIDIHRKTLTTNQQREEFKVYQNTVNYLVRNGFNHGDGDKAILTNKYEKEKIHPTLPQEMRKPFIDAKSVIKYPVLKVRGECLGRILTKERIQCHVDMLNYIDFEKLINGVKKKTIVFTSYVKVVDASFQTLKSKGFKPVVVYGDTNKDLASIVNTFEKDSSINPLIATFDSLSTAMPLTMANGVIFLNNPWRSFEKEQAIARAHRIGQDETVYCFDVILDTGNVPNISSRSLDVMQWSKDQVDRIMGFNGDVNVSLESNGFILNDRADINEVVEDVYWDEDHIVGNVVTTEEANQYLEQLSMEGFNLYPKEYQFYSQKN